MAQLTQDQLKALFETNDVPTQSDFTDLIDTLESNSEVVTTSVSGTGDVWVDFNANNTLVQTTRQINVILHNGTYYLFNASTGTFGIGNIQTNSSNFIQISIQNELGKVAVKQVVLQNTNATTQDATTLAVDFTSLNPPLVHNANQISIVRYGDTKTYMYNTWWLIDAEPGTYGLNESTLGANQFIQVGLERYTNPVNPFLITLTQSIVGSSTVVQDFNLTQSIVYNYAIMYIVDHPTGVYLFNWGLSGDKGEYNNWGNGVGYTATTADNFKLIYSKQDTSADISMTEADYLAGVGINIDFSTADNIEIIVQPNTAGAMATPIAVTATNLKSGQSGYIRFSRADAGLGIPTYMTFSSDFLVTDSIPALVDADNLAYYKYEIVDSSTFNTGPAKILLTSCGGETAIWV